MINYSKKVLFASLIVTLTLVLLGSCAPQADKVPEVQTSLSREIKEIRPGILEEEEYLREDGSYPSGHTAIGWAWALILTELFPEQCDVAAGRVMGAAAVARLHANADFFQSLAGINTPITST